MKLSLKFFCAAYGTVLLAAGLVGVLLVHSTTSILWNARVEQISTAETYAVDSFLSLMDLTPDAIDRQVENQAEKQITTLLGDSVDEVQIGTIRQMDAAYQALSAGEGVSRFVWDGSRLWMESACRVTVGSEDYGVLVRSDFTETDARCRQLWRFYGGAVLGMALVCGLLLYALTRRLAAPLNRLTAAAQDMAAGAYGRTVPAVADSDGEIAALSESFNRMSAAVQQTMEQLREEAERREQFVADFSHEMKTPMTAIVGYAQMLQEYPLNETETRQAAAAIDREGKRLERLSRRMLELRLSREETLEPEPVVLSALTQPLTETMGMAAQRYGVTLTVALPPVTVAAEEALLLSLLYNLTDNALKASAPGQQVTVTAAPTAETVTVAVRDEGRGVAPENLQRLTEPFFREDKARSRALGGAGLGLSICREIARLHGGELRFDSAPGQGTTVAFTLARWREVQT